MDIKELRKFADHHILGVTGIEKTAEAVRYFLHTLRFKTPNRLFIPEEYEFKERWLEWDYVRFSMFFLIENGILLYRKNGFYTLNTTKEDSMEFLGKYYSDNKMAELIKSIFETSDKEFEIAAILPKKRGKAMSEESLFIKGVIEDLLMISEDKNEIFSSSAIAKKITDTTPTRVDNILKLFVKEERMEKVPGGYKAIINLQ